LLPKVLLLLLLLLERLLLGRLQLTGSGCGCCSKERNMISYMLAASVSDKRLLAQEPANVEDETIKR
jgi:hypothetical protein